MKQTEPELERLADPAAVIGLLTGRDSDLDRKGRLLAALVRTFQRDEARELVSAMLWLGLWPGLDAIFRKYQRHFREDPAGAVSAIAAVFTDLVARLDLAVVQRVACSLVFGTRRNLIRALRREWRNTARFAATDPTEPGAFDSTTTGNRRNGSSFNGDGVAELRGWLVPVEDGDAERALASLSGRLAEVVGADAELVLAVLVLEETQLEAAARLGLSHDAARKRFQRATRRLRNELTEPMSHFDRPGGVSAVSRDRRSGGAPR